MKQILTFISLVCVVAQLTFAQQENDNLVISQFQNISAAKGELTSSKMKFELIGGKFEKMDDALFLLQLEKDNNLNCHFTLPVMAFDVKAYITYNVQNEDVKGRIEWNGTLLPEEETIFVKEEKTGLVQKEIQLKEFKLENDLRIMNPSSGALQILNVSVFYKYRVPNSVADIAQQAQTLFNEQKYSEARAKIKEALRIYPDCNDYIQLSKTISLAIDPFYAEDKKSGHRVVVFINDVEFVFRWCPAGTYTMGSSGHWNDEKPHQVTLTKGFWIMETEVTQKQWTAIMGNNPSHFKGDDLPVEQVTWKDCQLFCNKTGLQLPTEAQWEYACRAGTTEEYSGNLAEMAWYNYNSDGKTHPVGTKKPNAWGIYDMHGNVYEWCKDLFGNYKSGEVTDPDGPSSGSLHVRRGGSWNFNEGGCRSALRVGDVPNARRNSLGFRCVKVQ